MTERTAADALGEIIVDRDDFKQCFTTLEQIVTDSFLLGHATQTVDASSAGSLLRYADILSHSSVEAYRELAYTVIALLREYDELLGLPDPLRDRVLAVSEAVLIQLGNFPGIRTLQQGVGSKFALPLSRGALRVAKEVLHRTSRGDAVLTDTQFEITERMREEDYFSFSGPTSLGKSFIIKDALYDMVRRDELNGRCVVILVPTKALIGQTASDLRDLLKEVPEVNVATYPSLPPLLQKQYKRTVFVLTPERLLRYLAHPVREIDFLIVDEAHKVIAKNDTRSSLYYHAIVETTRRFATRLVFASPGIKNPELFLELFGKATNGALAVQERTVGQQRYFVDLVDRKQYHFSGLDQQPRELSETPVAGDAVDLVLSQSGGRKAIIYVNGSIKSSEIALRLAAKLSEVSDSKTSELIKHVKQFVHKDYFLGKTLKHGVAFHHGKMPQEVRERVEAAFADPTSPVQFVVCTSTLLEGVNLPAKNIFVLSDKHGSRNFTKIDFENLAGRAGRLTYDFSGNVICVREDEKRWSETTKSLIAKKEPGTAESFLVQPDPRRKKDYTDIAYVLRGQELPGNPSVDARRSVQQYASILMLHQLDQQQTPLRSFFLDKVPDGRELLKKAVAAIGVPTDVLRRSPGILPKYQSVVWNHLQSVSGAALLPTDTDLSQLDTFHNVLRHLSGLYNWRKEESQDKESLLPKNTTAQGADRRLLYWAMLMRSWVRGEALNQVISSSIAYHRKQGTITYRDYSRNPSLVTDVFNPNSAMHINLIIEWTLRDIEGGLRFRIIAYLQNYFEMSVLALGAPHAGVNVATLVEYGTADERAVELQEIGFSRGVATKLLEEHSDCMTFSDNGVLEAFDDGRLLAKEGVDQEVSTEVQNILTKEDGEASDSLPPTERQREQWPLS